ncbi:MAG: hypothetical protein U0805_20815 [Pirellulales bacterium]
MQTTNLQLTPEQREALQMNSGQPIHIVDQTTHKIYVLLEQGDCPELEEGYIREGLEVARRQIAGGEVSTASIGEVIAKAQQSSGTVS